MNWTETAYVESNAGGGVRLYIILLFHTNYRSKWVVFWVVKDLDEKTHEKLFFLQCV